MIYTIESLLITTVGVAFLATLAATPGVRAGARRLGLVDRPDSHRKLHRRVTPLGGGVAVLVGIVAAILFALATRKMAVWLLAGDAPMLFGLLGAAVVICLIGLLDDRYGLRGRQKLIGQVLAASIVIASGLEVRQIQLFHWHLDLGPLAVPFTLFWLLGAINALNLLDGVDGLATSVGFILSLALGIMALLSNRPADALLAFAVAGALAAFLCYNFPPASIFLGDAGSMLIGLLLGSLALSSSLKGPATVALAAPTAIWAIPIFDAAMAILRRKLTGRSIYTTDRGHLHHSLLHRGFSGPHTLGIIGLLCTVTAVGALWSVYRQSEMLAVSSAVAVVAMLVITRFFGHHECYLLCRRLKSGLVSLVPRNLKRHQHNQPVSTRLQGTRRWEELWQEILDFAEHSDLNAVQLNVNLPAIHEEFHATWRRKELSDESLAWHTDIPLVVQNRTIGRLKIVGASPDGSFCGWMEELLERLRPLEHHVVRLLEDEAEDAQLEAAVPALAGVAVDAGGPELSPTSDHEIIPRRPK